MSSLTVMVAVAPAAMGTNVSQKDQHNNKKCETEREYHIEFFIHPTNS